MKYMLMVCKGHIKEGITHFEVPHVKKISDSKFNCLFCKEEAKIEVFYSIPSLENALKAPKMAYIKVNTL